jgi:hypothetical protein
MSTAVIALATEGWSQPDGGGGVGAEQVAFADVAAEDRDGSVAGLAGDGGLVRRPRWPTAPMPRPRRWCSRSASSSPTMRGRRWAPQRSAGSWPSWGSTRGAGAHPHRDARRPGGDRRLARLVAPSRRCEFRRPDRRRRCAGRDRRAGRPGLARLSRCFIWRMARVSTSPPCAQKASRMACTQGGILCAQGVRMPVRARFCVTWAGRAAIMSVTASLLARFACHEGFGAEPEGGQA